MESRLSAPRRCAQRGQVVGSRRLPAVPPHTFRLQAGHRVPDEGRHLRYQSLPVQGLPKPHVGFQPVLQKSPLNQAGRLEERVSGNFRRLPELQSARQNRPKVLGREIRILR